MEKTNKILFVIGAPLTGKRTLAKRLAEDYGYINLHMGELLGLSNKSVF